MTGGLTLYAVREDGELVELTAPVDATNVHDGFESLGLEGGVYTALRTFDGERFLALDAHVARTRKSMELSGWPAASTRLDEGLLRRALQSAVAVRRATGGETVVRVDVLPPGLTVATTGAQLVLTLAPLPSIPPRFRSEGVAVEVARDLHRERPRIKTAEFVLRRRPYPLGTQEAYEHLMLDAEDRVLEATSANFAAVEGGRLRTAGEGVLEGITLGLVLEIAEREGIECLREAVPLDEVASLDEAFLTSSTRGVLPVVRVEGRTVGDGRPGPMTQRLARWVAEEADRRARRAWPPEGVDRPE